MIGFVNLGGHAIRLDKIIAVKKVVGALEDAVSVYTETDAVFCVEGVTVDEYLAEMQQVMDDLQTFQTSDYGDPFGFTEEEEEEESDFNLPPGFQYLHGEDTDETEDVD